MTATPSSTDVTVPAPDALFGRAVLDIAAQVEADEAALKRKLIACAKIREFDRMVDALEVWLNSPAADALRALDPCPRPEVTPPVPLEE